MTSHKPKFQAAFQSAVKRARKDLLQKSVIYNIAFSVFLLVYNVFFSQSVQTYTVQSLQEENYIAANVPLGVLLISAIALNSIIFIFLFKDIRSRYLGRKDIDWKWKSPGERASPADFFMVGLTVPALFQFMVYFYILLIVNKVLPDAVWNIAVAPIFLFIIGSSGLSFFMIMRLFLARNNPDDRKKLLKRKSDRLPAWVSVPLLVIQFFISCFIYTAVWETMVALKNTARPDMQPAGAVLLFVMAPVVLLSTLLVFMVGEVYPESEKSRSPVLLITYLVLLFMAWSRLFF